MRVRAAAVLIFAATTGLVAPAEARCTFGDGASLWRRPVSGRTPEAPRSASRPVSRRVGLLRVAPACLLLALAGPVAADPEVMTYRPCSAAQFREAVSSLAQKAPSDEVEIGQVSVAKGPHGLALTVPMTKRVFGIPYTVQVAVPVRQQPEEASLGHLTRALRGEPSAATVQAVEALSRLVVTASAQGRTWDVPESLQSLTERLGLPTECNAAVAVAPVSPGRGGPSSVGAARLAALD